MNVEIAFFEKINVLTLVRLSDCRKSIKTVCVYDLKTDHVEDITRYR